METVSTQRIRGWFSAAMAIVLVASLAIWLFQRDTTPRVIRIATGEQGGLYHKLGDAMAPLLSAKIGRAVSNQSTHGSKENSQQLSQKQAELAIIQGGAASFDNLAIVTPLFPEYVFVIVRNDSGINSIAELRGKSVSLGLEGSGNRTSAIQLLEYYDMQPSDVSNTKHYFKDLLSDSSIEAAVVTAGIENPDLKELMSSQQFRLVPVKSSAAIDLTHPFFRTAEIPRGIFSTTPPVPDEDVSTLATTAYLVTHPDASPKLVNSTLKSIHEESLRLSVPTLISRRDAPDWTKVRMHATAHQYFYPSDQVGRMANVMESLAATKELLFAFGAGIYLLWIRWKRLKDAEAANLLQTQKDRLDGFLAQTLSIEQKLLESASQTALEASLNKISRIKLKALQEFTEEELRGDQAFSIFLEQCDGLIQQIHLKIIAKSQT
jgi:TRAP transporter TAXI family solute receptor